MGILLCQALASGSGEPGTGECRLQSPQAMGSAQHCSFSSVGLLLGLGVVSSLFSVSRLETNTLETTKALFHGQQEQRNSAAEPAGTSWANRTETIIP